MKLKLTILCAVLLFNFSDLSAQKLPAEFFEGIKSFASNRIQAKKDMLATIAKVPNFHGGYHFLGVIYSEAGQQDSAIYYLDKAVALNTENLQKTKEMSLARLIEAHTYKHDFEKAFKIGLAAYELFPENTSIATNFKDACVWSYYLKYEGLDKGYLSPNLKENYGVTSIAQEYLIIRKLIYKGERVQSTRQTMQTIENASYDVHKLVTPADSTEKILKFKLNWDLNTEFGGKAFPKDPIIANRKNPIYERLGAILANEYRSDLKTELAKLNNEK